MKDDVVAPKRLVNVKQLDGLSGITYQPGNGLRLGALTTLAELAEDATVREHYPVLAEAAIEAASPQIRNLATLGGNMCQRPRRLVLSQRVRTVGDREESRRRVFLG